MSHNILLPYGKYLWLINTYSYPRNKANIILSMDVYIYIRVWLAGRYGIRGRVYGTVTITIAIAPRRVLYALDH